MKSPNLTPSSPGESEHGLSSASELPDEQPTSNPDKKDNEPQSGARPSNVSENSVGRYHRRSFRFSDCEPEESLPQFIGSRKVQYFAAFAANMGALALGTVQSWSAVALPDLIKDVSIKITDSQMSWVGSIIALGAVLAGPVAGYGIEKFGRRMSMLVLAVPFLAGWLLIFFANGITMILIGRFITGFCSGVYATAAPIYTAEMADACIRGTLCACFDMMISVGILFIFICGSFVSWRMQALICGIFPVVIFVLMLLIPESPRFLVQKQKTLEATSALLRFRGAHLVEQVDPELRGLRLSVLNCQEKSHKLRDLLTRPVLRPISIAFLIYFFQVFSGIDAVLSYTVDIFKSSKSNIDEYLSTIIIGVVQVVAALAGAFLVEYFGRRMLLMVSEMSMFVSLAAVGYYFFSKQQNNDVPPEGLRWLPLTGLMIYVASYSVGVGPVGYMINGEVLPHHVKGLAGGVLTSAKAILSFAMMKFFHDLIDILGDAGCYWLLGAFCLIGFTYVLFCLPETTGHSLDEIQAHFANS